MKRRGEADMLSPLHSLLVGFVRRTWLVAVTAIAVCSVIAVRTVDALSRQEPALPRGLTPARAVPPPRTVPDGTAFVARNMFCSSCDAAASGPTGSPSSTPALEALLISTTFGTFATVRVPATEVQGSWGLGERIPGVGTVARIGHTSIDIVDGTGRRSTLSLRTAAVGREGGAATPPTAPAAGPFAERVKQTGENTYDVDRDLVRELVTGAAKPGAARIVPVVKNGEVQGVRLVGVKETSAPAAIGLKSGDLLDAIDGEPIKTAQQMLDLYAKLDQLPRVTLQGKRGGKPLAITLTLR
ncbi:MAG: hypothetical protein SFX73_39680 [Kofleriaceae bacterium]|nr:hypothetical protein [Kofleriaceae bacterium]